MAAARTSSSLLLLTSGAPISTESTNGSSHGPSTAEVSIAKVKADRAWDRVEWEVQPFLILPPVDWHGTVEAAVHHPPRSLGVSLSCPRSLKSGASARCFHSTIFLSLQDISVRLITFCCEATRILLSFP